MASRSSRDWLSETYQGTRRGRAAFGDISWEQFPEKVESTDIEENPEQLNTEWRQTLKDFSPVIPSFEYEMPRRNVYSRSHLNLREGGFFGSTTDPWATLGDGPGAGQIDISFHDKDPRGFLTEQPWSEYRRLLEAQLRRTDFKDDGDYSTTSGHVHPNTLYSNIRNAQNWVKARMKIFETSFDNMHPGGVGVYPHVSNVFKSSRENTSVGTDEDGLAMTFEDPENRQRLTMHLSNIVHGGSKAFRVNTTTDHKVPVAAYGKLYRQRGLIPHESQLRILEEDTPRSKMIDLSVVPKNLVRLMSTALQDKDGIDPATAATSARLMYQDSASRGWGQEQFAGMRGGEAELSNQKRDRKLTKDIMALLGFVEQDVKFLESKAASSGSHGKQAKMQLANLYKMGEALHAMPANVKLEMRNELLLRSAGGGLLPGNLRKIRDQIVVNPKIVEHMDLLIRKSEAPGDPLRNREKNIGDSEGILGKLKHFDGPLFVRKSTDRASEDIDFNRRSAESTDKKHRKSGGGLDGTAKSYKKLARIAERIDANKRQSNDTQVHGDTTENLVFKTQNRGDTDPYETMKNTVIDNKFGENRHKNRHIGQLQVKSAARRYIQNEPFLLNDPVAQRNEMIRKNGQNLVQKTRM